MRVLEGMDASIANHVAMDMTSFLQETLGRKLDRTLKRWRIEFKDKMFRSFNPAKLRRPRCNGDCIYRKKKKTSAKVETFNFVILHHGKEANEHLGDVPWETQDYES